MLSKLRLLALLAFISLYGSAQGQSSDPYHYVLITSGVLNVRETPETGKVIFTLNRGNRVRILADNTSNTNDWTKIKTEDGKVGFVSRKYLGLTPPDTLDEYKLIGFVWSGYDPKDLPIFVPLAFFSKNGWQEAKDEYEFDYKFRSGVNSSLPSVALLEGEKGPSFTAAASTTYGCQEFPALKVKPSTPITAKKDWLVYSPDLSLQSLHLQELAKTDNDYTLFKNLAETIWKAKGYPETEWLHSTIEEVYLFKTPKKETFISGRIAFHSKGAERRYLYLLGRKSGADRILVSYEKSEKLTEELGFYGGSYHLIGVIFREEDPVPILLFTDIGYDSSIHSLYELRNGTLQLLLRGAGDAC
ncbi:SH3 domain-containing protein [Leptospira langatensis]|uniref:SH3 domain-containing protein n=1 Tax=Leptospira langatensis TaxID=2484983 RepID=A0A5F1ZUT2_9LEPT|nr:SH3 domain-containing protein [Leptospira langatensis]TGK01328.1 SH3 domain-containing protein [Leptospira langatensis]TGL42220.1 SH3 domain-containing protein [Leptospira langatensis]